MVRIITEIAVDLFSCFIFTRWRDAKRKSGKKISSGEKIYKLLSSGVFRFMLVKFRFWTAIYLLLELPSYKYHLKINFLNIHNRITNISVAAHPTAKDCSTKFQRTFTSKFSKTTGVSKNKLGGGEEKDNAKNQKGYISLALHISLSFTQNSS